MEQLKMLVQSLMMTDPAKLEVAKQEHLMLFVSLGRMYASMSAGTFFYEAGTVMPVSTSINNTAISIVQQCAFVDPLDLSFDETKRSFLLDHTKIPCFMEIVRNNDHLNTVRVYFSEEYRRLVSVGITYEEPGAPFSKNQANIFKSIPLSDTEGVLMVGHFHNLLNMDPTDNFQKITENMFVPFH